jgi:hypothetical protein
MNILVQNVKTRKMKIVCAMSADSLVTKVTVFELENWGLITISGRDLSLYDHVQTDWPACYIDRYQD